MAAEAQAPQVTQAGSPLPPGMSPKKAEQLRQVGKNDQEAARRQELKDKAAYYSKQYHEQRKAKLAAEGTKRAKAKLMGHEFVEKIAGFHRAQRLYKAMEKYRGELGEDPVLSSQFVQEAARTVVGRVRSGSLERVGAKARLESGNATQAKAEVARRLDESPSYDRIRKIVGEQGRLLFDQGIGPKIFSRLLGDPRVDVASMDDTQLQEYIKQGLANMQNDPAMRQNALFNEFCNAQAAGSTTVDATVQGLAAIAREMRGMQPDWRANLRGLEDYVAQREGVYKGLYALSRTNALFMYSTYARAGVGIAFGMAFGFNPLIIGGAVGSMLTSAGIGYFSNMAAIRYDRMQYVMETTMGKKPSKTKSKGMASSMLSMLTRKDISLGIDSIDITQNIDPATLRKAAALRAGTNVLMGSAASFAFGQVLHHVGEAFSTSTAHEQLGAVSQGQTPEQQVATVATPVNGPNAGESGLNHLPNLLTQPTADQQPHTSLFGAAARSVTQNQTPMSVDRGIASIQDLAAGKLPLSQESAGVLTSVHQAAENVPSVNMSAADEVARLIAQGPRLSVSDLDKVQQLMADSVHGKLPTDVADKLHDFANKIHWHEAPKDIPKDSPPPPVPTGTKVPDIHVTGATMQFTPDKDLTTFINELKAGDTTAAGGNIQSLHTEFSLLPNGSTVNSDFDKMMQHWNMPDRQHYIDQLYKDIAKGKAEMLIKEYKPQLTQTQHDYQQVLKDMQDAKSSDPATQAAALQRLSGDVAKVHAELKGLPEGVGGPADRQFSQLMSDWYAGKDTTNDMYGINANLIRLSGGSQSDVWGSQQFMEAAKGQSDWANVSNSFMYDLTHNRAGDALGDSAAALRDAAGDYKNAAGDWLAARGSWLNEQGIQTPDNVQHFAPDPNIHASHGDQAAGWWDKAGKDWNSDEFFAYKPFSTLADAAHAGINKVQELGDNVGHAINSGLSKFAEGGTPGGGSGGTPEVPYGTGGAGLHDIPVPGVKDAEIRIPDGWHFGTHGSDMNVLYDAQGHPVATGFHLDNGGLAFRYEPQFAHQFGLDTGVQHLGLEGHDPMVTNAHVTFDGKDVYGNPLRAGGNEAYNMTDYTDGRSLIIHGYGDVGQQANCLYIPAGNGQYMVFEPTGHLADGQPVWQFTPGDNTHLVHVLVNGREMTVTSGQAAQMLHINQGELQNWLANGNPPGESSDFSGPGQSILAHNVMFGQYSFKGGQLDIHQLGVIRGNSGNEQILQSNVYGFDQKLPPGIIPPGQGGPGAGGPGYGGPGGGGPGGGIDIHIPAIGEWPGDIADGVGRLLNAGKGGIITGVILLPSVIGGFMRGTKVGDPSNAETNSEKLWNNAAALGLGELIGFLPLGTPVLPAVGWGAGYLAGKMWAKHKVNKAARQAQAQNNAPAAGTSGQVGTGGTQPGNPPATPPAGPPARTGTPAANNYGTVQNVVPLAQQVNQRAGGRRQGPYNRAVNQLADALPAPTGVTPEQHRQNVTNAINAARNHAGALNPVNAGTANEYIPYDSAAHALLTDAHRGALDLANEANARAMAEIMMPNAPDGEKAAAADAIRRAAVIDAAVRQNPGNRQAQIDQAVNELQTIDTSIDPQKVAMQARALRRVFPGATNDIVDAYRGSALNTPPALAIVGAATRNGTTEQNIDAGFRAADVDFTNPRRATPAAEVTAIAQAMDNAFTRGPELGTRSALQKRRMIVERLGAMATPPSREVRAQVVTGLYTNPRERNAEAARLIRHTGARNAVSEDLYGVIRGLRAGGTTEDEIQRQFLREVRNAGRATTPVQEAVVAVMLDQNQGASAADRLGLGLQELAHNPNLTPGIGAGERAEQIADAVVAILDVVGGTGFSAQELQQRMRAEFPTLPAAEQAHIAVRVFDALHVPTSSRLLSEQLALALAATGIEPQTPNTPLATTHAEAIAEVVNALFGHAGGLAGLPEAIRNAFTLDNAAAGQVAAVLVENNLNGGVNDLRIIVQEIDDTLVPASATAEDYWAILRPAGQAVRAHRPVMRPIPAGNIDAIIATTPTLPVDIQAVMYGAFLPAAQAAGRAGVSAIIAHMTTRGGAVGNIDITQPDQKLALVNGLRVFRSQARDGSTQITEAISAVNGSMNRNTRRTEVREALAYAQAQGASDIDQARLAVMVAAPRVAGPPANIEELQTVVEELVDGAGLDINVVRQAMAQVQMPPAARQAVVGSYIRDMVHERPIPPGGRNRNQLVNDQLNRINEQIARALAVAGYPPRIAGSDRTMVTDVETYLTTAGGLNLRIPIGQLVFI